tara:strand:- start:129 stop:359 length:231 start_codon:yes stop_codon:yes gene_type:complete
MLDNIYRNIQKKSLRERFLLVIAILFFMFYFVLGLLIIFMDKFPLDMATEYRWAFGLLLMAYSVYRGWRLVNENRD